MFQRQISITRALSSSLASVASRLGGKSNVLVAAARSCVPNPTLSSAVNLTQTRAQSTTGSTSAVPEPTVADLLSNRHAGKQNVLTIPMDATIQSAARLMMSHKIGSLVVTDSKSKEFQGIITERDLLKVAEGVVNRDSPVSEIMTGRNKIVACSPTDSIISVMTLINNNNIRHVPVLQAGANKVEAVVSIKDCIDHVIKEHQKEMEQMKTFVSGSY